MIFRIISDKWAEKTDDTIGPLLVAACIAVTLAIAPYLPIILTPRAP